MYLLMLILLISTLSKNENFLVYGYHIITLKVINIFLDWGHLIIVVILLSYNKQCKKIVKHNLSPSHLFVYLVPNKLLREALKKLCW